MVVQNLKGGSVTILLLPFSNDLAAPFVEFQNSLFSLQTMLPVLRLICTLAASCYCIHWLQVNRHNVYLTIGFNFLYLVWELWDVSLNCSDIKVARNKNALVFEHFLNVVCLCEPYLYLLFLGSTSINSFSNVEIISFLVNTDFFYS